MRDLYNGHPDIATAILGHCQRTNPRAASSALAVLMPGDQDDKGIVGPLAFEIDPHAAFALYPIFLIDGPCFLSLMGCSQGQLTTVAYLTAYSMAINNNRKLTCRTIYRLLVVLFLPFTYFFHA